MKTRKNARAKRGSGVVVAPKGERRKADEGSDRQPCAPHILFWRIVSRYFDTSCLYLMFIFNPKPHSSLIFNRETLLRSLGRVWDLLWRHPYTNDRPPSLPPQAKITNSGV
eukprot:gene8095-5631_t